MKIRMLPTGQFLSDNRGFSFLEIIIVIVIMAMVLSVVLPNFTRMFASIEGARQGSKVLHLLERARADAILKAEPVHISFYKNGKCVFKIRDKEFEYSDLRMTVQIDDMEADFITQIFYPDGTANLAQLKFKTLKDKYITYSFNPVTGKIEMERGL